MVYSIYMYMYMYVHMYNVPQCIMGYISLGEFPSIEHIVPHWNSHLLWSVRGWEREGGSDGGEKEMIENEKKEVKKKEKWNENEKEKMK